jgi:energy-coupling factor transporter ATP-binding protein EcfA2
MSKSRKDQLQLDYEAGFTSRSATSAIALTALAAASIGTWATVPAWIAALTGGIIVAGAVVVSFMDRASRQPYRVATGLAVMVAVWTIGVAVVLHTGARSWAAAGWWTAVAGFFTLAAVTWWVLDRCDIADEAHHKRILDGDPTLDRFEFDRKARPIAMEWVDRIERAIKVRPVPREYGEWASGGGFTLVFEMPQGSRTDAFTTGVCRQMAEDARLPHGCTISVDPGTVQGTILMRVQTKDPAGTVQDFPYDDLTPITINGGIPCGPDMVGNPISAKLREACVLIVGPPGSGKTTLLDAMIAGLVRCADTVVWGIDVGKRGGAFRKWSSDLPAGATRGVWPIASTHRQALDMVTAAIRIAEDRATGSKLLTMSAAQPQIMIVIDEGAEILSYMGQDRTQKELKEQILKLMRTTRSAGVRLILTATDANVAAIGDTQIKKYAPVRAVLTSTDPDGAGVQKLFGGVRGLDPRQLRAPGAGVIDVGHGPQVFRTWKSDDALPGRVMAAVSSWRPVLDRRALAAAGEAYEELCKTSGLFGAEPVEEDRSNVVDLRPRDDPFAGAMVTTSTMRAEASRKSVEQPEKGRSWNPFADM